MLLFIFLIIILIAIIMRITYVKPLKFFSKKYKTSKIFTSNVVEYNAFMITNDNIGIGKNLITMSTIAGVMNAYEPTTGAFIAEAIDHSVTHKVVRNTRIFFGAALGSAIDMYEMEDADDGFSGIRKQEGSTISAPDVEGNYLFGNTIDIDDMGTSLFVSSCMEDGGRGRVYVYNRMEKIPAHVITGTKHLGSAMACARDASYVVCADNKTTKIFHRDDKKFYLAAVLPVFSCKIVISPNSEYIAISEAASLNFKNIHARQYKTANRIHIYKKLSGGYVKIRTISTGNNGELGRSLTFAQDGTLIVSAKNIKNIETGNVEKVYSTAFLMISPLDNYITEPELIYPELDGDYTAQCKFYEDSIIAVGESGHVMMRRKVRKFI
jgi:hypothetical protein